MFQSKIYEAILAPVWTFPILFQRRLSTKVWLPRKRASCVSLFETGHCLKIQTIRLCALENRWRVGWLQSFCLAVNLLSLSIYQGRVIIFVMLNIFFYYFFI